MHGRSQFPRKNPIVVLLAMFLTTGVFGLGLLAPRAALAVPVEVTADPISTVGAGFQAKGTVEATIQTGTQAEDLAQNTTQTSLAVQDKGERTLRVALQNTAAIALLNGLNYFAQKIAYDAAVYVASGGKGQGPLIFDSPGAYFKSVGADAAGEVLGTITQNSDFLKKYGINLCAPSNPRVALNLKLGFLRSLPSFGVKTNVPTPKCTWDSIENNWDTFTSQDSATVLDNVGVMFSPGESSLAAAIEVNNVALKEISRKKEEAGLEYQVGQGFKAVTDKISGTVKTPASTVKKTFEYSVESGFQVKEDTKAVTIGAVGSGALAVLTPALKTFAGTLTEQLMKKIFERGLISVSDILGLGEGDTNLAFDAAPPIGGRVTAELANASLLTPKIITLANYNEITDFASCPNEGRNPNNCVIDQQFFGAVSRADQGAPLTLRQAMDQGFVSRNWQLLPLAHAKNIQRTCYNEAFCYSNLVKLRKARVIPIGWELAANSPHNDINRPVTIGEAMDRFNDCPMTVDADGKDIVDVSKLPDPLHPWCHLVDPEWVLKYPTAVCRQQAPGPTLLSPQSSVRTMSCVDVATCVAEDASGNCIGGYGYCVREKSAWKLDADACPASAASCTTYKRADGASFSYLANTLDGGPCNSENAGCRRYSLSPNAIPNPSFEDVLDVGPRDWTLTPSARFHRGGRLSLRGTNAVGVTGGSNASVTADGLLPGTSYRLSISALQEIEGTSAVGTARLAFRDSAGAAIASGTLTTTCRSVSGGTAVELDVASTSLGYLSAGCEFTTPPTATSAVLTLSSDAPAGNTTWFDDVGLFGSSFSASPYDAIFMNAKVEKCAADGAGCTDFVRLSTATRNMLRNGSFEDAFQDVPEHWDGAQESAYENGTIEGFDGPAGYALSPTAISQRVEGVMADAAHVFSVYSRLEEAGSVTGRATIQLYDTSPTPAPISPVTVDGCVLSGSSMRIDLATGSDFSLSECRFTTPSEVGSVVVTLTASAASPRLVIDAAQLELSVRATQFHEGYTSSAEHVFLKKAPEGLDCTGSNPPASCARYAPSCRRDEVGCNSYTPVDGGASIPAVTTDADICPSECSGYDTFRQEPTVFSDARFPLFLIPSTAGACTAAEEGCSEFTNIERLSQGGETREYYSYLRLCAAPGPQSATFYTWEGNDVRGFQLRTWGLLRSNIASAAVADSDPTGGNAPCTKLAYDVSGQPICADDAASVAAASCLKGLIGLNPDCREFYDEAGNIHYRLYSKTVVSTEDCKEYRITKTTEQECRDHGGFWRNGECRYRSYASESVSCRAEAAGCRAYSGNASRNVRIVFADAFETGTTGDWSAAPGGGATADVVNSNESVSAGGHSLKVTRPDVTKGVASSIKQGRQYLLTFWAKGSGDLSARFSQAADASFTFDPVSGQEKMVALTTEWRSYQIGPVEAIRPPATGSPAASEQIVFERVGGAPQLLYLDNIELREVTGNIFMIEDSWETPVSCDSTPTGDPAPQYMLGCRSFTDRESQLAHFKSFEKLCRQEAVGCEALYDTRNSPSPFTQTFNAVCTNATVCTGITCPCEVDGRQVCQVGAGSTTCRYDIDDDVDVANVSPTGDTVRIPNDGIVYLVNDRRYRCESAATGCVEAGNRTLNPDRAAVQSWSGIYIKNLPASYASTLCKETEEFCQAYTRRADGAQTYFKDPDTRVCEYRETTMLASNGVSASGWYRKGSDVPCDEEYLEAGTRFGIWKNSDPRYEGWAGSCDARYDMCKEFIDPEDRSDFYPGGKPYYAIQNARLDAATCQGRASLRQSPSGANQASSCVLFWQTDNLVKTYDAYATYQASEASNGALVTPVSTDLNSANIIIKVKRDRQCGEWLDCRSSETVFNPSSGAYQGVCTAFSLCVEYERVGNSTRCIRYADSSYTGATLSQAHYAGREVGWQGMEYSGFSIPGRYPVEELVTVNVGTSASEPDLRLVRSTGTCTDAYGASCGPAADPGTCLGPSSARQCVYPIDGGRRVTDPAQLTQAQLASGYPGASCRAYPQENSPFPSTVADPGGWNNEAAELNNGNPTLSGPTPAFAGANVCQRRFVGGVEFSSCECSYFIARYGSQTKFFPAASKDIPQGYCVSGSYDRFECDPLATGARTRTNLSCCTAPIGEQNPFGDFGFTGCSDGGQCIRLNKIDRVVGYEGQCLERDFTTTINGRADQFACLTWRPVGLIAGSRDIYNQNQSAGYFAPADRRFYCVGEQGPWALRFSIPSQTSSGDLVPYDVSGDGVYDYNDMDIMRFFGPGKVTNGASSGRSQGKNCEDEEGGKWCVWPSASSGSRKNQTTTVDGQIVGRTCTGAEETRGTCGSGYVCVGGSGGSEGQCLVPRAQTEWFINGEAYGILGCYEVADGGAVDTTYIEYPYVGPPMYRQQLSSIYFQISDDLYDRYDPDGGEIGIGDSSTRVRCPGAYGCPPSYSGDYNPPAFEKITTNPNQNVLGDCNDETDDNIDNEDGDGSDTDQVGESILTSRESTPPGDGGRGYSVFHLDEKNGFKTDPSDGEGTIVLQAMFDQNGKLQKVKIAAADGSDEGSFGIREMGFIFKPGCQEIVQVDEPGEFGATVAFTNTVNPVTSFQSRLIRSTSGRQMEYADACQPYGAVGSVSRPPTDADGTPLSPWAYVARRADDDYEQCVQTDFTKAANYLRQAPESLAQDDKVFSLRRLFRKIYGVWEYVKLRSDGTGGNYRLVDDEPGTSGEAYDETSVADIASIAARGDEIAVLAAIFTGEFSGFWHPPRVASVNLASCSAGNICRPGKADSITVNGKDEGIVLGADGAMNVTAKFYAWASHNSMPILRRTLLWGDFAPAEPPSKGWYRNQKPLCSPDTSDENAIGECKGTSGLTCDGDTDCPGGAECMQSDIARFGNTPGACMAAPYQFDHSYTCALKDLQAMSLCTGPTDAADNAPCARVIAGTPVCVYRPKVQIVDNWGWCNCSGSGCREDGGAYGAGCDLLDAPPDAEPWNEFAGEIRLMPTYIDGLEFMASGGPGSGGGGGGGSGGVAVDDNLVTIVGIFYSGARGVGLLDNDTVAGPATTRSIAIIDPPAHGRLANTCDPRGCFQITPEGGINYIADSGFHGTDTFSYQIIQGGDRSNVALVTMTVP